MSLRALETVYGFNTIDIKLNRPSAPFESTHPTASPVWKLPMSSNQCIIFEFPAQIYDS